MASNIYVILLHLNRLDYQRSSNSISGTLCFPAENKRYVYQPNHVHGKISDNRLSHSTRFTRFLHNYLDLHKPFAKTLSVQDTVFHEKVNAIRDSPILSPTYD